MIIAEALSKTTLYSRQSAVGSVQLAPLLGTFTLFLPPLYLTLKEYVVAGISLSNFASFSFVMVPILSTISMYSYWYIVTEGAALIGGFHENLRESSESGSHLISLGGEVGKVR